MDNGMILWFLINLSPHTCTQFVRFYYFLPLLRYSRNVFDLNERKKKRVPSLINSVPDSFFLLFSLPHWNLYRSTHSFDVHLRDRLHHRHQISNVQMNRFQTSFFYYPFSLFWIPLILPYGTDSWVAFLYFLYLDLLFLLCWSLCIFIVSFAKQKSQESESNEKK